MVLKHFGVSVSEYEGFAKETPKLASASAQYTGCFLKRAFCVQIGGFPKPGKYDEVSGTLWNRIHHVSVTLISMFSWIYASLGVMVYVLANELPVLVIKKFLTDLNGVN